MEALHLDQQALRVRDLPFEASGVRPLGQGAGAQLARVPGEPLLPLRRPPRDPGLTRHALPAGHRQMPARPVHAWTVGHPPQQVRPGQAAGVQRQEAGEGPAGERLGQGPVPRHVVREPGGGELLGQQSGVGVGGDVGDADPLGPAPVLLQVVHRGADRDPYLLLRIGSQRHGRHRGGSGRRLHPEPLQGPGVGSRGDDDRQARPERVQERPLVGPQRTGRHEDDRWQRVTGGHGDGERHHLRPGQQPCDLRPVGGVQKPHLVAARAQRRVA